VLADLALGEVVHETQLEDPALDFGQRLPAFRDGVASSTSSWAESSLPSSWISGADSWSRCVTGASSDAAW
jgi:hypothetical protein